MKNNEVEVLLVEDNVNDAELTVRALKKINLANKLHHVNDGAEALDFLFCRGDYAGRVWESKPKLVLLDIKMPRVDGIEVLRQLKVNEVTRAIPVVVITSSKEEQDILKSYHLGANSYVVKPVDFEGFVDAVCKLAMYWLMINQPPH